MQIYYTINCNTKKKLIFCRYFLRRIFNVMFTTNEENTAKSVSLVMDESSTLTLTGDIYLSSLQDDDSTYSNINFNGYKLYVNETQIN